MFLQKKKVEKLVLDVFSLLFLIFFSPCIVLGAWGNREQEVAAHKAAAPVLRDRASEPERSSARGNLAISKKFSTQKL